MTGRSIVLAAVNYLIDMYHQEPFVYPSEILNDTEVVWTELLHLHVYAARPLRTSATGIDCIGGVVTLFRPSGPIEEGDFSDEVLGVKHKKKLGKIPDLPSLRYPMPHKQMEDFLENLIQSNWFEGWLPFFINDCDIVADHCKRRIEINDLARKFEADIENGLVVVRSASGETLAGLTQSAVVDRASVYDYLERNSIRSWWRDALTNNPDIRLPRLACNPYLTRDLVEKTEDVLQIPACSTSRNYAKALLAAFRNGYIKTKIDWTPHLAGLIENDANEDDIWPSISHSDQKIEDRYRKDRDPDDREMRATENIEGNVRQENFSVPSTTDLLRSEDPNRDDHSHPGRSDDGSSAGEEESFLDIQDVADLLKMGKSTIYKVIKNDPSFPRPKKLGRSSRWLKSELTKWLASHE